MSKRVARKVKRKADKGKQKSGRRPLVIICSLLILTLCVGVMVQWKILPGTSKPLVLSPNPTDSFAASNPSKEYIYAGSRLIATEEPAASSATPTPSPTATATPTPTPPPSSGGSALFVRNDSSTQGNWKGVYGSEGYNIIGDAQAYPSYAQIVAGGNLLATWAASTTDTRALQKAANVTDRIASCWYQRPTFTIDVNITDGREHQLALYALDWDGNNSRSMQIEVRNAVTNTVLDSRSLSSFSNGQYLIWSVSGHLTISINRTSGDNAVISGLFFDDLRSNVALSSKGSVAKAYSQYSASFPVSAVNNGDRFHPYQSDGRYNIWHSATGEIKPDLLEIDFGRVKAVDEIDVVTMQDDYQNAVDPTLSTTFSQYGLTSFDIQYWDGTTWQTIPGASVTGSNKVWRKFTFPEITTQKIRLSINGSVDNYSRVVELEAWGRDVPGALSNVASSIDGAQASASSIYTPGTFNPSGAIDGDRRGINWGANGGWNDAGPANSLPDWLEVDFSGQKTISEVDVFTGQDAVWSPVDPTPTQTFSYYGLTEFKVQYWNGSAWADIPGASTTGNNLVWKKFTFSAVTTSKIRVWCTASADGWSRITEVEAWGN